MLNRNDPLGLVERARKNLEFVEREYEAGRGDVHVVTQLILSLLGLIVFPVEGEFHLRVEHLSLSLLEQQGWPAWSIHGTKTTTLGSLLKKLRNAVAHGNISFSSEGRKLEDVQLGFWNNFKDRPLHWQCHIEARHLRLFCARLFDLILAG